MAADGLATQRARASAAMERILLIQNNHFRGFDLAFCIAKSSASMMVDMFI